MYQSIPSLTITPWATPRDSHILVAPGVRFLLLCLAQGVLNQSKSSISLKKARFLLCLCNLLHGRSEMVLAKTNAPNERNFQTDAGLKSARP